MKKTMLNNRIRTVNGFWTGLFVKSKIKMLQLNVWLNVFFWGIWSLQTQFHLFLFLWNHCTNYSDNRNVNKSNPCYKTQRKRRIYVCTGGNLNKPNVGSYKNVRTKGQENICYTFQTKFLVRASSYRFQKTEWKLRL